MNVSRMLVRRVAEAPWLPIVAYFGVVGLVGLVSGAGVVPKSIDTVLPRWLVFMWTVSLAAGGVMSTVGYLGQWTRTESSGLGLLAYGAALYAVVLSVVSWPRGATAVIVVLAIVSMCLIRMRVLSLSRRAVHHAFEGSR